MTQRDIFSELTEGFEDLSAQRKGRRTLRTRQAGRATPEDQGVLEAAFDGKHGWFWRNRTSKPVTVTLRTEGNYIAIKRVI